MGISHVKTEPLFWERGPKKPPPSPGIYALMFLVVVVLWLVSILPHWLMIVLGAVLVLILLLAIVTFFDGRKGKPTTKVARKPTVKADGSDYTAEYRAREALAKAKAAERDTAKAANAADPRAVTPEASLGLTNSNHLHQATSCSAGRTKDRG